MIVILAVVGGTAGLGTLAGLGSATILAGLTALFCFMAANGGPLLPDLKVLAGFAPAVVVACAAPRLLAEVSQVAAITVLVMIVFVACLMPRSRQALPAARTSAATVANSVARLATMTSRLPRPQARALLERRYRPKRRR
jgi:hypothetical protein